MKRGLIPFSVVVAGLGLAMMLVVVTYVLVKANAGDIPVTPEQTVAAADATMGPALVTKYGCGGCHVIPGIEGARGRVGPDLSNIGERAYLVGNLPNNPANMVAWIMEPQAIEPGTAMPDLRVTEEDARDIAAYLYSLD